MGMKPRIRTWVAWLINNTDRKDDKPIKVKAASRDEAWEVALTHLDDNRFSLANVYTIPDFCKYYPDWRNLI